MTEGSTTYMLEGLLQRFAAGDEQAKRELIENAIQRLMLIARRLLRDFGGEKRMELWTAEIVSSAYPRMAKALDDVQPTTVPQFFGLARLQMHRALLDHVRSLSGRDGARPRAEGIVPGFDITAPDNERQRMLIIDLLDAITNLPEKQAATVHYKLAGCTHREIAEYLGVHHDTVDTYWNQACVKLAKELAPFMER